MRMILLCLLVTAAQADTGCTFGTVTIVGLPTSDGADIVLHNRLTGMAVIERCQLNVDGVIVGVIWHSESGTDPDTVTIIAPQGYQAFPPEVTLEEDEEFVVAVRAIPIG